MALKVEGDPSYGSMSAGGRFIGLDGSETVPLLNPEPHQYTWKPLSKEDLEKCAGGPGWTKFRSRLVLVFWISWVVMLGSAIAVIVQTPRTVAPVLLWWQKDPFYRLQPALLADGANGETNSISRVSERLPYLKSLGVGAVILEGLFRKDCSPPNLTQIDGGPGTLNQFKQLMTESRKEGLRIVLDLCELDLFEPTLSNDTEDVSRRKAKVQTLMEWSVLMREFSSQEDERILMVRQTDNTLPAPTMSNLVNGSLVTMFTKSLIPPSHRPLTAAEVAEAIETSLQMPQGDWPSWTLGGKVPLGLQRALLVLMMTLPGTPIIKYGDEINPIQVRWGMPFNSFALVTVCYNSCLFCSFLDAYVNVSYEERTNRDTTKQGLDELRRPLALFYSLSQSRAREGVLRFGSFTFITFNTTMSSSTLNNTSTPHLAFLRSWGCVHFLAVFNLESEPFAVDPEWAAGLPKGGEFVISTGLDRLGPVSLRSVKLQPHEAIVMKLFHTDNSS